MVMTPQVERKAVRHKLERHVAASARARHLFAAGEHLLVAVSGGPDSVALLSVVASLAPSMRLAVSALHINYGLSRCAPRMHESLLSSRSAAVCGFHTASARA